MRDSLIMLMGAGLSAPMWVLIGAHLGRRRVHRLFTGRNGGVNA